MRELQRDLAGHFAAMGSGTEGIALHEHEIGRGCAVFGQGGDGAFAQEFGVVRRRGLYGEGAAGETLVFAKLECVIVCMGFCGIEEQYAEGMAWEAVVTEETLKTNLFYAGLFVDAGDMA